MTKEAEKKHPSDGPTEVNLRLRTLWLKFIIALVERPQNYWMTEKRREAILMRFGYTLDQNGRPTRLPDNQE